MGNKSGTALVLVAIVTALFIWLIFRKIAPIKIPSNESTETITSPENYPPSYPDSQPDCGLCKG